MATVANESHRQQNNRMNSLLRSISTTCPGPPEDGERTVTGPGWTTMPLSQLGLNRPAVVCCVDAAAAGQPLARTRQLGDIGFVPGERVVVLTRAWPGRDPLVVLVGHSRFALRSAEAACILVQESA
jgi:ferrous iron transport protein A